MKSKLGVYEKLQKQIAIKKQKDIKIATQKIKELKMKSKITKAKINILD